MASIATEILPFEEKPLHVPNLEEVKEALSYGLKSNFNYVKVEIVNCPNMTQSPYHMASEGLCGSPTIVELGGPPYLLPTVDFTKLYDLVAISQKSLKNENIDFLTIGAGAGPWPMVDMNCEGMYNFKWKTNGEVVSGSHLAKIINNDRSKYELVKIPNSETRCALLGNLFVCEGKPGKVIKVSCKKRTGKENFIASIRRSLLEKYGDKTVGLGGMFLMKTGEAKQHIMPPFSETPINTEEELNEWLNFYNMKATLIAVGTLVTNEYDLDLRLQHFHSFSMHGDGGHYHIDVTPDIVEYEGYFSIGEKIVRVDKPKNTHKFGRD